MKKRTKLAFGLSGVDEKAYMITSDDQKFDKVEDAQRTRAHMSGQSWKKNIDGARTIRIVNSHRDFGKASP